MTWGTSLPVLFRERTFETEIDRLFEEAFQRVAGGTIRWTPDCNVYEDDQQFVVELGLPGIDMKDVEVRVEDGELFVNGQRKSEGADTRTWYTHEIKDGAFGCSFSLPSSVDRDKSTASYKNGMLRIAFAKREEARPKRIMIECQ
ncbi:MAG TPA: Hsp20/alpha crystallin family protein [Nitrospira sp.]|nr:Hsp20/alpha crystallin family protein [Nitrospira sp.]